MATPGQIRTIHTLKGALRLDDETYRAVLSAYGVTTSTALDKPTAERLIKDLAHKGEQSGVWTPRAKKFEELGERPGMATPSQLRRIDALWAQVSRAPTAARRTAALDRLLRNRLGITSHTWLESRDVGRVIKMLQAMIHYSKEEKDVKAQNHGGQRETVSQAAAGGRNDVHRTDADRRTAEGVGGLRRKYWSDRRRRGRN